MIHIPYVGGKKVGYLTRDEVRAIIKDAHAECRAKVPITSHKTPSGRSRLGKDRTAYLNCLKEAINKRVKEILKSKGYNVA